MCQSAALQGAAKSSPLHMTFPARARLECNMVWRVGAHPVVPMTRMDIVDDDGGCPQANHVAIRYRRTVTYIDVKGACSAQIYWVGIGMGSNFKDCCSLSVQYSLTRHRNRKNLSNRVSSQSIPQCYAYSMVFITWLMGCPDCP